MADHGRMKSAAVTLGLCLVVAVLALTSGTGPSTPDTLPDMKRCLAEHGASGVSTHFFAEGEDAEENAIANLITGYNGTVTGTFHGDDFQVDMYDDVYLNEVGGSEQDFAPLAPCYDTFGPSPWD